MMAAQLRHQYCAHVPGSVHKLLDPISLAVSCAHHTVTELAGIHLAIGPLLSGCYKIVTTVNQLHQSYKTDKWKALYHDSDMMELLGQLNDNITLLNTILNQRVSMSKQDKVMDMMANNERTLQNMPRARGSFRKYLQEANVPLDNEVASILTARTSSTALAAFDFDSIIMRTSVYKRCMARGSDNNELLVSLEHLAANPATVDPRSRLAIGSAQLQSAPQFDAGCDEDIGVSQSDSPSLGIQHLRAQDGSYSKHLCHDDKSQIYGVPVSSKLLLAAVTMQTIQVWNLSTGEKLADVPWPCRILPGKAACLAFSPDGETLAARKDESPNSRAGRSFSSISLLVAQTGKVIYTLHDEDHVEFDAIAFSSDNNVLAFSSRVYERRWDIDISGSIGECRKIG
ncbi:tricorn protease domain 2-containing protein [Aureobasidium pullulans]|uniref:Tricorn protease domain 2-containing protein n=1 Tax=Aureobasidium pullulans TaxID=5580 RepID=A0A4S9LQ63_AURPU|nr:tricorn protease domain 2-containing protein [Aureobasidium pullulans]